MTQWVDFRPLEGQHRCDNCDAVIDGSTVNPIAHFAHRVEPGGIVPSGECPICGALCYPVEEEEEKEKGEVADADRVSDKSLH